MLHRRMTREDVLARLDELGWHEWRTEPQDFLDFGDRVVVPVRQVHPNPPEGVDPERQRAHYWKMGPAGAERLEVHRTRANAVNAAVGYFALLERLHERLRPRTYVEIGVHLGRSLGRVPPGTKSIGIDPEPVIADPAVEEASKIFRVTSDAFFRDYDLRSELGGLPVDLRLHRRHAPVRVRPARLHEPRAPLHGAVRDHVPRLLSRPSASTPSVSGAARPRGAVTCGSSSPACASSGRT